MMRVGWIGLVATMAACAPHLYTDGGIGNTDDVSGDDTDVWTAPSNSWKAGAPPVGLRGEGMDVGDVALDIHGTDQFGAPVSLWQFYGDVVLFDISTLWCGPCRELAADAEAVYQEYKDQGFTYITVITESTTSAPPTTEELGEWAKFPAQNDDPYDLITSPIIADPDGESGTIEAVHAGSYPVALVIGRDMRIVERLEPVADGTIKAGIEDAL